MYNFLFYATVNGVEKQYTFIGYGGDAKFVEVTKALDFWQTILEPGDIADAMSRVPQATEYRVVKV